jgi:hypothetical protein
MVLDFCKEHGITVKLNKDNDVALATANTDDMTVGTNAKDMDAYANVTNDSDSNDGKMETDEDVGNKMDADERHSCEKVHWLDYRQVRFAFPTFVQGAHQQTLYES